MNLERELRLPGGLGKPAQRALAEAGIQNLEQLSRLSEAHLRRQHGIGPHALGLLKHSLEARGLAFAPAEGIPFGKRNEAAMETITDLQQIFNSLKGLLDAYRPPLSEIVDRDWRLDLASIKDVVIEGRKRKEVYFASLIIQKDYVGFYFMPVYGAPEMKAFFPPELLKLLKGKSCFHVRKLDEKLREQIGTALKDGFALYQARGWV